MLATMACSITTEWGIPFPIRLHVHSAKTQISLYVRAGLSIFAAIEDVLDP